MIGQTSLRAVAAATAGGATVAVWQAGVARAEQRRAEEVKTFIVSLLQDANLDTAETRQATAVIITPATLPAATPNVAYAPVTLTLTGGTGAGEAITHFSGALPGGMSYDAPTRTLSGTPVESGVFPIGFRGTDGGGNEVVQIIDTKPPPAEAVTATEKGLNGQLADQKRLLKGLELEQQYLRSPLTYTTLQTEQLRQRRAALAQRLDELNRATSAPGRQP